MPKKIDINLKILEKLYLIDKLTYQQIADKLNVSKTFIYSKMKEINVKPRENIYYKSGIKHTEEYKQNMSNSLKNSLKHKISQQNSELRKLRSERFKGKNNPMYGKPAWNKGNGYIRPDGYNRIWVNGKAILEHQYIWIKENQMPVPQSCCIHHINGIKDDNRIENLQMMPNSSHMELHNTMKLRDGGGRFI